MGQIHSTSHLLLFCVISNVFIEQFSVITLGHHQYTHITNGMQFDILAVWPLVGVTKAMLLSQTNGRNEIVYDPNWTWCYMCLQGF